MGHGYLRAMSSKEPQLARLVPVPGGEKMVAKGIRGTGAITHCTGHELLPEPCSNVKDISAAARDNFVHQGISSVFAMDRGLAFN